MNEQVLENNVEKVEEKIENKEIKSEENKEIKVEEKIEKLEETKEKIKKEENKKTEEEIKKEEEKRIKLLLLKNPLPEQVKPSFLIEKKKVQKIIYKGKPNPKKNDEATRTVLIENLSNQIALPQLVDFFSVVGPIAFLR
jgi:hypothetical protein